MVALSSSPDSSPSSPIRIRTVQTPGADIVANTTTWVVWIRNFPHMLLAVVQNT